MTSFKTISDLRELQLYIQNFLIENEICDEQYAFHYSTKIHDELMELV